MLQLRCNDHRFGWMGHSFVRVIAGALSGHLLQTIVLTVVTAAAVPMNQDLLRLL